MKINYKIERSDYTFFHKSYFKQKMINNIMLITFVPIVIAFYLSDKGSNVFILIGIATLGILIAATIFIIYPYLLEIRKIDSLIKSQSNVLGPRQITFNDLGFEITDMNNGERISFYNWEGISSIINSKQHIQLITIENAAILIPKNFAHTHSELTNILGFIKSQINRHQPVLAHKQPDKRPSYLYGIFCIIPLIGAFVGLLFLYYGLIKYKDKWFTIIGGFGILLTAFLYGSLWYETNYGTSFNELKQSIAQDELNSLLKEIEFYKSQNYEYPDSLQNLKLSQFTFIQDPTQKDSSNFYYQKEGSKYYLFSKGADGIEFTEDDITPNIEGLENIGLIKTNANTGYDAKAW